MTLRCIRERAPFVQCSTVVPPPSHDQQWRRDRYGTRRRWHPNGQQSVDPARCQHAASHEIDGVPYCRRHAAMIALDRWEIGILSEFISADTMIEHTIELKSYPDQPQKIMGTVEHARNCQCIHCIIDDSADCEDQGMGMPPHCVVWSCLGAREQTPLVRDTLTGNMRCPICRASYGKE